MEHSSSSWVRIYKDEDSEFVISTSLCLWFLSLSVLLLCILLALLGCQQLLARMRRQGGQVNQRKF